MKNIRYKTILLTEMRFDEHSEYRKIVFHIFVFIDSIECSKEKLPSNNN